MEASMILGIIGAAAWLPIIITPILKFFAHIDGKLIDAKFLINAIHAKNSADMQLNGTIVLMAINFYVPGYDFFALNTKISIKTNFGKINAILLDYSNTQCKNSDGTLTNYKVENKYDLNKDMLIFSHKSNIKFISIFLPNTDLKCLNDIKEIMITFKRKICCKSVKIKSKSFPNLGIKSIIEESGYLTKDVESKYE